MQLVGMCCAYEWVTSHMNESRHIWMSHVTHEWVTSHMNKSRHIWTSHVTYMNEPRHIHEWATSHKSQTIHSPKHDQFVSRCATHQNMPQRGPRQPKMAPRQSRICSGTWAREKEREREGPRERGHAHVGARARVRERGWVRAREIKKESEFVCLDT